MAPNPKRALAPADEQRLRAALDAHESSYDELRAAVLAASANGASVRVLAEFLGKSTNTISRWKTDARP
ncbi:helix-turn-helix domain-containing protein [Microbacterium sp. 5K110]|uniref:helix-turn-helix domain-containing protein n=1 Tax=Microbacterium sp. 5K110 TaxID=2578104 RepID=UPI0014858AD2|nr:helix-turn-helix domain-containing protein [Microbacterium sp. 5K110]